MMYLTDLPSLSSLNLEMHSGETETLVRALASAGGIWTGHVAAFLWCVMHDTESKMGGRTRIYSVKLLARASVSLVEEAL